MNNFLDTIKNQSGFGIFQLRELHMFENYPKIWVNLAEMGSQKSSHSDTPLILIREEIFKKLNNFKNSAANLVDQHALSYQRKKATIPYGNPIEKKLNDCAMDRMEALFRQNLMKPMKSQINTINTLIPTVQSHFDRFKILCQTPETKESATEAKNLAQQMHTSRRELNTILFKIAMQMDQLQSMVKDLNEKGEQCGPSFKTKPALIMLVGKFINRGGPLLKANTIEEGIEIIEDIKQAKSVCCGAAPLQLLFVNAIQAMRRMEKGMGTYLGKQFKFPSGFTVFSCSANPLMESFRTTSAAYYKPELIAWNDVPGNIAEECTTSLTSPAKKLHPLLADVMPHLTCPLSKKIFNEPVIIETGYSFEGCEIAEYLKTHDTCPVTNEKLVSKQTFRNLSLKSIANNLPSLPEKNAIEFLKSAEEFNSIISLDRFSPNIVVLSSGISYEPEEVAKIIAQNKNKCFLTQLPIDPAQQYPNKNLASILLAVEEYNKSINSYRPEEK